MTIEMRATEAASEECHGQEGRAPRQATGWAACIAWGSACWLVTGAIVIFGAWCGWKQPGPKPGEPFIESLHQFDAGNYLRILESGYSYSPDRSSLVAFFPGYPVTARVVRRTLGLSSLEAMLVVAHVCLLGAFVLLCRYLSQRAAARYAPVIGAGQLSAPSRETWFRACVVLSFALLPTTFFFRMPYSESMLLLVSLASLYAMERRWPLPWIAAIVGLATAVRPVGVALLLPMAWHVVRRTDSWRSRIPQMACLMPLACWGLLAYMTYQYLEFGDGLAFAKTQTHWRIWADLGWEVKVLSLCSWEPLWSVYVPGSAAHWRAFGDVTYVTDSMRFVNPIYFAGTAVLIAVGAWKRWLTTSEILLAIPLLAIPYVTRAHEMCMESHGRFAAVVFPAYIVMAELLSRIPPAVSLAILAGSALMLGFYASRFAQGYMYF